MANKILLSEDEYREDYNASDSEEEYTEREKHLLQKYRKGKRQSSDDKEEVLAFDDSDAVEDEDEDLIANSDVEGDDVDDDVPDSKAWGKKRSAYYNTDFIDQDYSTYNEKEEELAVQEEEEAKMIQQRLAKQLDETDFSLDIFSKEIKKLEPINDGVETRLKTDLSDLTIRQKQQLFQKDSPEFSGLVQDFENYLNESQTILQPALQYANEKQLKLSAIKFVNLRNNIIHTYCTNIAFYLILKAQRIPVKNHPIVKRLVQLKQLLKQMNEKFQNIIHPQIDIILQASECGLNVKAQFEEINEKVKKKNLQILQVLNKNSLTEEARDTCNVDVSTDSEGTSEAEEFTAENEEKRAITYQIAKNKGLTPHRKKELRNPRVKHRNKYRKALIRRKGAVRSVRNELKRYGGEISGIKATVKKGIKIKS